MAKHGLLKGPATTILAPHEVFEDGGVRRGGGHMHCKQLPHELGLAAERLELFVEIHDVVRIVDDHPHQAVARRLDERTEEEFTVDIGSRSMCEPAVTCWPCTRPPWSRSRPRVTPEGSVIVRQRASAS